MDWSTLQLESGEYVDQELRHLHSDLLYRVQLEGRPTLVFVLFEHQSTADPTMPLRLLRYMTRVWERFAQDQPGQPLPPIVPMVLHHSDAGWRAPMRLREMLDVGDVIPGRVTALPRSKSWRTNPMSRSKNPK